MTTTTNTTTTLMETLLPYAQGPEKSVLSSILKNPRYLMRSRAEGLGADHFGVPVHAKFFRFLMDRVAAGKDLELVALVNDLAATGTLEEIGGPAMVTDIYTYAPNDAHFGSHVKILREYLARRVAILAARDIVESGHGTSPEDLAGMLRTATDATQAALQQDSGLLTARDAVAKLLESMLAAAGAGEMPGLSTGLAQVDAGTGGMRPGELWIVAAEPSCGKSVLMLQAAAAVLEAGKRVLVISLEMGADAVISRMVSCLRSVPYSTFTLPRQATARELTRAKQGLEEMSGMPLSIHDRGGLTFDEVAGIARCEADRHGGIDLLVVDYLQLIEGPRGRRKDDTREQEVARISRGLKGLAKSLGCPVFSASQLNDQGRLRESRAIGQDADVVLIIEEEGIRGLKVRNGARGQFFGLTLNGGMQRFESRVC